MRKYYSAPFHAFNCTFFTIYNYLYNNILNETFIKLQRGQRFVTRLPFNKFFFFEEIRVTAIETFSKSFIDSGIDRHS